MAVRTWVVVSLFLLAAPAPAPARPDAPAGESLAFVNPISTGAPPVLTTTEAPNTSESIRLTLWAGGLRAGATYGFYLSAEGAGLSDEIYVTNFAPEHLGQAFWEPPQEWPDGVYTLRATLYRFDDGVPALVAEEEMDVRLLHHDGTRTHRASFPMFPSLTNRVAFFGHEGETPAASVFYYVDEAAPQVRALYSTAARGAPPRWTACGAAVVDEDGGGWVQCRLAAEDDPRDVALVGVVANGTDRELPPDPALDLAGEALPVKGYEVRPQVRFANAVFHDVDHGACMGVAVEVEDQTGFAGVWDVDVDVMLRGSRFGATSVPPQFDAPEDGDESHPAAACGVRESREATQGRHGDAWHVEGPTDPFGSMGFLVKFEDRTATSLVAWIDRDRDDAMDHLEERVRVRYAKDPSFRVWAEPERLRPGRAAWLYAAPRAIGCGPLGVELQSRPSGGRWRTRFRTGMQDLAFEVRIRPRRTTLYRIVVSSYACPDWTSDPVTVRVSS